MGKISSGMNKSCARNIFCDCKFHEIVFIVSSVYVDFASKNTLMGRRLSVPLQTQAELISRISRKDFFNTERR